MRVYFGYFAETRESGARALVWLALLCPHVAASLLFSSVSPLKTSRALPNTDGKSTLFLSSKFPHPPECRAAEGAVSPWACGGTVTLATLPLGV